MARRNLGVVRVEGQPLGIGGSAFVSKDSEKKKPQEAVPYLIVNLDENNLDALIEMAFLNEKSECLDVLKYAESKGRLMLKRRLGNNCFDDNGPHVGEFWGIFETRPYMRVLLSLVRMYFENGKYEESANTSIEMLRLCPNDNKMQRASLGSLLLRVGRASDALSFAQAWLSSNAVQRGIFPPRGGTTFKPPSRKLVKPSWERNLSEYGPGSILHTAALASYKLYGDCPQSQQYLKMAANANHHILRRILESIARPSKPNMEPQTREGKEEAEDYLWLTQDLWMEPDVWTWANNNADVKKAVLEKCGRKDCTIKETRMAEFKQCDACHKVSYCSQACQREDWPKHKPDCNYHQKIKSIERAMATGEPIAKDFDTPDIDYIDGSLLSLLSLWRWLCFNNPTKWHR